MTRSASTAELERLSNCGSTSQSKDWYRQTDCRLHAVNYPSPTITSPHHPADSITTPTTSARSILNMQIECWSLQELDMDDLDGGGKYTRYRRQ